jgi:hypothetical protein
MTFFSALLLGFVRELVLARVFNDSLLHVFAFVLLFVSLF